MALNAVAARLRPSVLMFAVLALMAWLPTVQITSEGGARAAAVDDAQGKALVEKLRSGGFVLFFRHADTTGMPCDRSFRIGDREGQRNLSPEGREQARRIGKELHALGIPVEHPVQAGPVYRARDTAELAFGAQRVHVTDSLLADDMPDLAWTGCRPSTGDCSSSPCRRARTAF